ncbi:MAG: DUF3341 domain-containing protein [Fimbriimonadaceae bacterium]
MAHAQKFGPYGTLAEFPSPSHLIEAASRVKEEGYTEIDAFTPYPLHGLFDVLDHHDSRVGKIVLGGGFAGLLAGLSLESWVSMVAYPMNVGGKPMFSWPAFIPVAYECTILFAAFGAVIGMLALNGLPRPHHPVFSARNFERASQDAFFLCIEAKDPMYDSQRVRELFESLGARSVSEVEDVK